MSARSLAWTTLLLALCAVVVAGCGDPAGGGGTPVPDGTVVLTFDDAIRNQLTLVAPLLEEHGFGATFFVTERGMSIPGGLYLTWPEIAELHRRGFEIGNHTSAHMDLSETACGFMFERDTDTMEKRFRAHGIPLPTSFAWPGSAFGPEGIEILRVRGYRFARRGARPERDPDSAEPGPVYDPRRHSPLLIPSAVVGSGWTPERLVRTVDLARGGKVVVLQFHGVPDPYNETVSVTPRRFREFLRVLADRAERVIAMRDLAQWVDPDADVRDPLVGTRWPGSSR